ncbi:DUF2690 domain-containing protein [Kitasatospora sp. NPDC057015]|uniref:helix-turn-helix domain-containing protein n=1 Tax=Kitasatospora sp. NPDC057015 TaxID=3346001 RepID=UPI00363FE31F
MSESTRLLVEHLRDIKDTQGWSLAETARRTHFSKASWERWLNGKRLITRQALDSLLKASGADSAALTALFENALADEPTSAPPEPAGAVPAEPAEGETVAAPAAQDPAAQDPTRAPAEATAARETAAAGAVDLPKPPKPIGEADSPGTAARRTERGSRRRLRIALVAALATAALALTALLWKTPPWQTSAGHGPTPTATNGHSAPGVAPPCQGVGCVGKDPQGSGCAVDARTLLTANVGERIIYLRYSQRCLAAWAGIKQGAPKDTATITTNSGQQQTAEIHWGYDNYSAMVDASSSDTTLQVCGVQPAGRGCTGVYNDPAHQPWPAPTDTTTPSGGSTPPPANPPAAPSDVPTG